MTSSAAPQIRAVICTVYGGLLEKQPPVADAEERWPELWARYLHTPPPCPLADAVSRIEQAREKAKARGRAAGLSHPVPYLPHVAAEAFPELRALSQDAECAFLYGYAQLRAPTRMRAGAALALKKLHASGVALGLCSNGDPNTPVELALAFEGVRGFASQLLPLGLDSAIGEHAERVNEAPSCFARPLCFWGFAHGFGKPDVHVFHHLARRLAVRGIAANETLIAGDSEAEDLAPARAFGWQAWRLAEQPGEESGNWFSLAARLGVD